MKYAFRHGPIQLLRRPLLSGCGLRKGRGLAMHACHSRRKTALAMRAGSRRAPRVRIMQVVRSNVCIGALGDWPVVTLARRGRDDATRVGASKHNKRTKRCGNRAGRARFVRFSLNDLALSRFLRRTAPFARYRWSLLSKSYV